MGSIFCPGGGLRTKSLNSSGSKLGGPQSVTSAPHAVRDQRFDLATHERRISPTIVIFLFKRLLVDGSFGLKKLASVNKSNRP